MNRRTLLAALPVLAVCRPAILRAQTPFAGSLVSAGATVATACTSIPSFASNVKLLAHFDGTNGSTSFTDSSPAAHTMVSGAAAALTTAQKKFGTASLDLTGSNKYAQTADSADWAFGSGQFTVECWARAASSFAGGSPYALIAQFDAFTATDEGWFLGFLGNTLSFYYSTTGTNQLFVGGTYTPVLGNQVHYRADRDASNVIRVYANGAVIASATVPATLFDSSKTLKIGNDNSVLATWPGQIDEALVVKGAALSGGAFTPPTLPYCDV